MSEIARADRPSIIWVAAVALVGQDRRVLLQRRKLNRAHGGLWEFPGGKIEAGESPEAAATREIAEELGVDLEADALQPVSFASSPAVWPPQGQPHVILLYACRQWRGEPRCLDADEIGWFAPEQLPHLDMPPLDYPLARALIMAIARVCPGKSVPARSPAPATQVIVEYGWPGGGAGWHRLDVSRKDSKAI